jgi:outer membrane beta-barrel protein
MLDTRGPVRRGSGHSVALFLCGALAFFASGAVAKAQSKTGVPFLDELGTREQGQLEILQNRKYNLLNEFFLQVGGLPADAYNKGVTLGAGYAIHFSQFVAWEVADFQYSFNVDSGLKKKLQRVVDLYGLGRPQLPEINWFISSHLVLKPIYGKQAIFNRQVIHMEAFLLAGPAIINRSVPGTEFDLGANVGAGLRFWMTQTTSFRIDIQELLFFGTKTHSFDSALHLHAGLAWAFGGDD